ncbi:hypothetical protein GCM10010885_17640 [Alicyclobacillus cellulosilyticus]|uniref:Protein kinase domain-containing protein n=1 Tax=Alicyclobacillus cellulosilyticus TaxID=1003997 RepID=A0A917KE45_9BACL|nr:phosphotransferase [Alicyclobacillus cellulosilyticus]GGJ09023.1 hypothetical protein GCM10010885_17640 [Alicyclobacillus cellulosilyticus]
MPAAGRFQPGVWVTGRWTGERFWVERLLGAGANGEVYLVRTRRGRAAMKVSSLAGDIALEWSVMEALRGGSYFPEPMLIDDVEGAALYFYVMEWIPGRPLPARLTPADAGRMVKLVAHVAAGLGLLHQRGYAFCDLKPENVLWCDGFTPPLRFVDVGGVTPFGRSVRQFTPAVDRAFWDLGTRESDPAYDLCALALWCVTAWVPPNLAALASQPPAVRRAWLDRALRNFPMPERAAVLRDVFAGRLQTSAAFLQAWQHPPLRPSRMLGHAGHPRHAGVSGGTSASAGLRLPPAGKRRHDWTDRVMWGAVASLAGVAAWAWGTWLHWF